MDSFVLKADSGRCCLPRLDADGLCLNLSRGALISAKVILLLFCFSGDASASHSLWHFGECRVDRTTSRSSQRLGSMRAVNSKRAPAVRHTLARSKTRRRMARKLRKSQCTQGAKMVAPACFPELRLNPLLRSHSCSSSARDCASPLLRQCLLSTSGDSALRKSSRGVKTKRGSRKEENSVNSGS